MEELSVFEKINNGDYKNKLPYDAVDPELEEAVSTLEVKLKEAKRDAAESRKAAQTKYYLEDARLEEIFRKDLESEHGMTGNPKAGKVWSAAWEEGHSAGYSEIANVYGKYAEIAK